MKKIKLVETHNEGVSWDESLGCRVDGMSRAYFDVCRAGASDEAWEAVKERLFGDPDGDLPEGVAVAGDGRMYAPGDVVQTLPDGEWERRVVSDRAWRPDCSYATRDYFYEVRRRPSTPRTERVAWWEAKERRLEDGRLIFEVASDGIGPKLRTFEGWGYVPDGTVEVLVEDGPR